MLLGVAHMQGVTDGAVQLSHPYMTIGKTIALTRSTFAGKVLALLLNMLFISFGCVGSLLLC